MLYSVQSNFVRSVLCPLIRAVFSIECGPPPEVLPGSVSLSLLFGLQGGLLEHRLRKGGRMVRIDGISEKQ